MYPDYIVLHKTECWFLKNRSRAAQYRQNMSWFIYTVHFSYCKAHQVFMKLVTVFTLLFMLLFKATLSPVSLNPNHLEVNAALFSFYSRVRVSQTPSKQLSKNTCAYGRNNIWTQHMLTWTWTTLSNLASLLKVKAMSVVLCSPH